MGAGYNRPMARYPSLRITACRLALVGLAGAAAGCSHHHSHFNRPLPEATASGVAGNRPATAQPAAALRTSFAIDGERGNRGVLMFLALSGGGSRAAYLSAATMLRLQTLYPEADLLEEVDVLSAVSGGSITAALYAASRDTSLASPTLASVLPARLAGTPLAAQIQVDAERRRLQCKGPLSAQDLQQLQEGLPPATATELRRLDTLCRQAPLQHLRDWESDSVLKLTRRNFLTRWFGNWLWPQNIVRYWFTAYDRGDIMAETLGDNLYGTRLLGGPLKLSELNPTRPFLLVNATTATDQDVPGNGEDEFAFGSVFTFTQQDFRDRIFSDIGEYPVARAVMASSTFPLVFPSHTLRDFRPHRPHCVFDAQGEQQCIDAQYLHVFDGGNSDNLGLKSIKRALLQMETEGRLAAYDRIVVMLVDAFTRPRGASRLDPDPRGPAGLVVDFNVSDAVDALLQNNRNRLLAEFDSGRLRWSGGECKRDTRELPGALCESLQKRERQQLDLRERLVFYHFGFDDLLALDARHAGLKRKLDYIPTSFSLDEKHAELLDEAVALVITPDNRCLQQIRDLVLAPHAAAGAVTLASTVCRATEGPRRLWPMP